MSWKRLASVASEPRLQSNRFRFGIVVALVATALVLPAEAAEPSEELLREWKGLLELATLHNREARERIVDVQKEGRDPIGRLATILLEEWNLDKSDSKLTRPKCLVEVQIDFKSLPEEEIKKINRWTTVVDGSVSIDGRFSNAKLIGSTGSPEIDRMLLELGKGWLFRPAYGPRGFQETHYQITLTTHFR